MAKPRVFISSTFYDLKHVRSSLETFLITLGYDPVLSEKGSIAYSPEVPLDESCYREAMACDIFVLIVGGRYGSEVSDSASAESKGFFDRYESVTRKEYESALERGIPIYIMLDKSVHSEYETYKRNRHNKTIKYAHVDSVNMFDFIDYILSRPRNNPVYHFELSSEIETWLRDQWAGLFREMLRAQKDRAKLSSMAEQVADLINVSSTLKRYLEEVIARVLGDKQEAKVLIDEEDARLATSRILAALTKLPAISDLAYYCDVSTEAARNVFTRATSLNDLAKRVEALAGRTFDAEKVISYWKTNPDQAENMNAVRTVLGFAPLAFEEEKRLKRDSRKPADPAAKPNTYKAPVRQ
jgi:hypothetical protein